MPGSYRLCSFSAPSYLAEWRVGQDPRLSGLLLDGLKAY